MESLNPSGITPYEFRELAPHLTRTNIVLSEIIEIGLMIMREDGASDAAEFLSLAGVPVRTTSRVLLRPDLRRKLKRNQSL